MIDLYCAPVSSPRARHAVGEQLLRREAARRLGIAPDAVPIQRGAHGKPEIPGLCCNLSHSGELAVCAFAESPVGVDIVSYREAGEARYERLAERYFSAEERGILRSSPCPTRCFAEIFARKEAVVKESGKGLSALRGTNTVALPMALETTLSDSSGEEYYLAVYCPN